MNLFNLVFTISDTIFKFANEFYLFFTQPMSGILEKADWTTDIPFIGGYLSKFYQFLLPFSFLDIMGSSALATILVLIVIKRIVPVA
jgi:hypothetical protein